MQHTALSAAGIADCRTALNSLRKDELPDSSNQPASGKEGGERNGEIVKCSKALSQFGIGAL